MPACCGGGGAVQVTLWPPPPPDREDPPRPGGYEAATAQTAGLDTGHASRPPPYRDPAPDRLASDEGSDMQHTAAPGVHRDRADQLLATAGEGDGPAEELGAELAGRDLAGLALLPADRAAPGMTEPPLDPANWCGPPHPGTAPVPEAFMSTTLPARIPRLPMFGLQRLLPADAMAQA